MFKKLASFLNDFFRPQPSSFEVISLGHSLIMDNAHSRTFHVLKVITDKSGDYYELAEHPSWLYPAEWFERVAS